MTGSNNIYEIDILHSKIGEEVILSYRIGQLLFQTQFNFSKITKILKILGLIAIISYISVLLCTWIYANLSGHEYFSAGEPVLSIKYAEWVLGILGIFVAFDYLQKEIMS